MTHLVRVVPQPVLSFLIIKLKIKGKRLMDDKAKIFSQNQRGKTDQSLKDERQKTDGYLDFESQNVEDESDETVQLNRLAADKKLE
jgi:hypothetical protein